MNSTLGVHYGYAYSTTRFEELSEPTLDALDGLQQWADDELDALTGRDFVSYASNAGHFRYGFAVGVPVNMESCTTTNITDYTAAAHLDIEVLQDSVTTAREQYTDEMEEVIRMVFSDVEGVELADEPSLVLATGYTD